MDFISPILAHMLLVFILMFLMGFSRVKALKEMKVKIPDIALGQPNWPEKTTQIANSFNNQFQMPILFYVLILLLLLTKGADPWQLGLAWAFVAMRYFHAIIHITHNKIRHRFYAYLVGNVILMSMFARFVITHSGLL